MNAYFKRLTDYANGEAFRASGYIAKAPLWIMQFVEFAHVDGI